MRVTSSIASCLLAAAAIAFAGCAATVGSNVSQSPGKIAQTNAGPTTISVASGADGTESSAATGVGPGRYTVISGDELRTLQSGSTPRDLWYLVKPDGSVQFNLSSGSDINAEGLEFDPTTRLLKVKKFGTSSSEPIRSHNEAFDRLTAYWAARDQASRDVIVAQIQMARDITPDVKDVIVGLLKGLGIP